MDQSLLSYFKTIGEIQSCVSTAETLDEALQKSLHIIVSKLGADLGTIWYADSDKKTLHPYFWIGPVDLTSKEHASGDGSVGRVFESQTAERLFDFAASPDTETVQDYAGVDIESMICVPFSNSHENLGCIQFINERGGMPFTDETADICEIMASLAAIAIDENERIQEPWKPGRVILSARDVKREFQNGDTISQVLKGVNLDVYEGEFLVLLGESGCGKSTFLNIIAGMDQATSGTICYEGEDLSNATQAKLTEYRRDNIGFIFQSYNLMPNLNAIQNLNLIGELVENPVDANEALEVVGLAGKERSYPSQMSGGQQQRISIARALVKNPRIILADEPTAALDYATGIEVLQVLERVVATGTTLVMVTHNEEITRMADRVVRMRNGRMYEVTVNRHRAKATDLVW